MRHAYLIATLGLVFASFASAGESTNPPKETLFLMKAAQSQQGEIELGTMAVERAANDQVKQFGQRMIDEHTKANQQVKQLAKQEGVELPQGMTAIQKEKAQKFSKLSGKEFDKAYIDYMTKDHRHDVTEFEHSAREIQDTDVRQWAQQTLPKLKNHLEAAQTIASNIGAE
jgi:putative membrane protein